MNREVDYEWVIYETGKTAGLVTVRRIVKEDVAYFPLQSMAKNYIADQKRLQRLEAKEAAEIAKKALGSKPKMSDAASHGDGYV